MALETVLAAALVLSSQRPQHSDRQVLITACTELAQATGLVLLVGSAACAPRVPAASRLGPLLSRLLHELCNGRRQNSTRPVSVSLCTALFILPVSIPLFPIVAASLACVRLATRVRQERARTPDGPVHTLFHE